MLAPRLGKVKASLLPFARLTSLINERIEYLIAMGITPEDKQQPESEFNRLNAEKEALEKTLADLD